MTTLSFLPFYAAAQDRTLRQFIEAFWCEGSLRGELTETGPGTATLTLRGTSDQGGTCHYEIDAVSGGAFGRLRLTGAIRHAAGQTGDLGIATVVRNLVRHLEAASHAVQQFVTELQHTALKQAYADTARTTVPLQSAYPLLEARLGDGHLYHPCFRSRIGFSTDDNLRYAPEFAQPLHLVWLALDSALCDVHGLDGMDYAAFLAGQLGEAEYRRLLGRIIEQGRDPGAYRLLPAHPWHWEHCLRLHYADWLAEGRLLHLGSGTAAWLAQQSVRSLSPLDGGTRHHVKLPLGIANSSADRILSDHHVHNAPLISRWLGQLCRDDPYFRDGARLAILSEPVGITLAPQQARPSAYGLLGAIWRSSPETLLAPGEQAFPMTGLCTEDDQGALRIAPWLAQHGAERWLDALLEAVVPPFLHLMTAHGVLLEGHAQNTILFLRDGLPTRIAIRDLPGGLHYLPGQCTGEAALAGLRSAPAYRNLLNASGGFTFTPGEARDYLLEVLFFINLGELAHRLARHGHVSETRFWRQAARTVQAYQAAHPAMAPRHRQFDLLGPDVQLECLASRRLLGWTAARFRSAANPLHTALNA